MAYDFGYRFKALREQKRMTQTQVAKRLNPSKATISGYENNIKTPSVDVLIQLSILYGVTTDYLLGLDNHEMLNITGLTDRQKELLRAVAREFKVQQSK